MPLRHLRKTLSWITPRGFREPLVFFLIILVTGGTLLFVELADEVIEGDTQAIDRMILLSMREPADTTDPLGPLWFEEMARDVTALGGVAILSLITAAAILFLAFRRKFGLAVMVFISTLGGSLLGLLLKNMFDRPRPDLVTHLSHALNSSFPSGHSMMAAVTYLTLGALLAQSQPYRNVKIYFILLAAFLTMLVGLSRVYLGVHWPTDVLGGWTAGAIWALGWWYLAHWLQLIGTIEDDDAPPPESQA